MIRPLVARELREGLPAAASVLAALALYVVAIVAMFDPSMAASLDQLMESMPELYDAFGMGHDTSTLTGFLLNYLYGFLLTLVPLVLVLMLVSRMVVRPAANGQMAWVLATPHRREAIALSYVTALVVALAGLLAATWAFEVASAEALFPGELDLAALARVNAGLFALWLLLAGVCLLSACAFASPAAALWVGGGLCLVEFLVQMASQVGDALADARHATFFALFDPYGLAACEAGAIGGAVALAVAGVALLAAAVAVFSRRDLAV